MRVFILSLIFGSATSFAFECETFEAQVLAEVVNVETDSLTYCKGIISPDSIHIYSEHLLCPLDITEVLSEGISFPLISGHDCEVPKTLSGVLVKGKYQIYLEQ